MTNKERYKTTDDRVYAFRKHCIDKGTCHDCALNEKGVSRTMCVDRCILNWLELEAEEEEPINCPCCGGMALLENGTDGCGYYWEYVVCHSCGLRTTTQTTKGAAVDKWNRRVK